MTRSRALLGWLVAGVSAALAAIVAAYFINPMGTASWDVRARLLGFMVYRIPSESMVPTLVPGDVVLVDTKAYRLDAPLRGDVIVFFPPEHLGKNPWIKRVVAVAGDRVELQEGTLLVDTRPQPRQPGAYPAIGPGQGRDMDALTVPAGQVFVMGDNRDYSMDSRHFGPVPQQDIVGRMPL